METSIQGVFLLNCLTLLPLLLLLHLGEPLQKLCSILPPLSGDELLILLLLLILLKLLLKLLPLLLQPIIIIFQILLSLLQLLPLLIILLPPPT